MTTEPFLVPADDQIDLRQLAAALARRWPWILAGGLGGLLVAGIVTARSKPVWEGEMQIVLAKRESGSGGALASLAVSNPMLANLAGLSGAGGGDLTTEVTILESPSVLKPIFDQVKRRKASAGDDVARLRFADWVNDSLTVELEKGTSVLNISYRDTTQAEVLPVLQQISKAYQSYSGRDRSESLQNGLSYATAQVGRFRAQAASSNRALDAFRIRYGISSGGGTIGSTGVDVSKWLGSSDGALVPLGGSTGSNIQAQGDPLGQLASINQELIRRRQTFTDRDPSIAALQRERDALRRYIETTGGGSLALPGQRPASKEEAQSLLLRYQELERTANRDNATLNALENTLLSLQLEQARATKPWELISNPTLLEKPVSPSPARNMALGLLAGLALGSGGALVADRRSGKVYDLSRLKEAMPGPLLARVNTTNQAAMRKRLQLLADNTFTDNREISLIPIGLGTKDHRIQIIIEELGNLCPSTKIIPTSDLAAIGNSGTAILISELGAPTQTQLNDLNEEIELIPHDVTGWLLLDENK